MCGFKAAAWVAATDVPSGRIGADGRSTLRSFGREEPCDGGLGLPDCHVSGEGVVAVRLFFFIDESKSNKKAHAAK